MVLSANYVKLLFVMLKAKPAKKSPSTSQALVDALAQAGFATMAILNKLAAENDLSLTQLRVAGILRDRRLRMVELAGYLGLEKSTMTGLVDRAEKRGLMARAPNAEDGRAIDVFLTKEGLQLATRMEAQWQEAMAPLIVRLNAAEQKGLQGLLERMLGIE
ncbi:MAG: MarR family transcriptional regulator [Polyangiaceae bacterium]